QPQAADLLRDRAPRPLRARGRELHLGEDRQGERPPGGGRQAHQGQRLSTPTATAARADLPRQGGFSLIEILVVITIIGLLMTLAFGPVQNALEAGRVTKCKANLAGIGKSFIIYRNQRNKGRWPEESGMRFLLTLVKHKQIEGKDCEVFLCPGTADRNDTGPSGEDGSSYDDWDNLDSATISYAGR